LDQKEAKKVYRTSIYGYSCVANDHWNWISDVHGSYWSIVMTSNEELIEADYWNEWFRRTGGQG
jgi:hypothetical protein